VVCGYDGSPESAAAVQFGGVVARALGDELGVLHVSGASPVGLGPEGADLRRRIAEQWRERIDHLGEEVGQRVIAIVEEGDPCHWLLSLAAEESTDVVVLGSRGRGEAAAAMLGSVSRRVAAEARAPVVIVPPGAAAEPETDALTGAPIVCGVDGSAEADGAVAVAARLVAGANGRLVLANVSSASDEDRHRLSLLRRAHDPLPESVPVQMELLSYEGKRCADALRWLAVKEGAKLIAVGSRGRGSVSAAVLGSTSGALAHSASCPVLIVPPASIPRTAADASGD
jgi:nucleotide-binding universal stress UspA family protein